MLSIFPESRSQLPTCRLLAVLEKQVSGSWGMGSQFLSLEMGPFPARKRGAYWEPVVSSRGGIPGTLEIDEVQPEFRRVGHSLLTLLLAVIGGVIGDASLVRRRRIRARSIDADPGHIQGRLQFQRGEVGHPADADGDGTDLST